MSPDDVLAFRYVCEGRQFRGDIKNPVMRKSVSHCYDDVLE